MNQVSEQIKEANRAGVETFETMAGAAFSAIERMAALNLGMARNLLEQRQSNSRRMLAVADPRTLYSLQAGVILEDSKQAMDYSQRAFEISSQARESFTRVLGKHLPGNPRRNTKQAA